MRAAEGRGVFEVRQGSRHLQYPVRRPQRQAETLAGGFQPEAVLRAQQAVFPQPLQVEERVGHALAPQLPLARRGNDGCRLVAAHAVSRGGIQGHRLAQHGDVQIDAVEQRPGQLAAIALDLLGGATATCAGVAEVAARAGIHRRDQLEACRKTHLVVGPGNDDFATFEW